MRKIQDNPSRSHKFSAVELWREDVEEILSLLTQTCKLFTISDGEFEYTSIDEMSERCGETVLRLIVEGKDPYVELSLGYEKMGRFFRMEKNTLHVTSGREAEYLFFQLQEYLQKHERIAPKFLNPWVFWATIIGNDVIENSSLTSYFVMHHPLFLKIEKAITAAYALGYLYKYFFGFTRIILVPRKSKTTFWSRKRDDLAVGLIIAAVAALLGYVVGRLTPSK